MELLGNDTPWEAVLGRGVPLVVHDPACPLTPAAFIAVTVDRAAVIDRVMVGSRPVTDTIKIAVSGRVGQTVDRDSLILVTSPVVLPMSVVATLVGWPDLSDLAAWVSRLRMQHLVEFVPAPPLGRRVDDESAVRLLEAIETVPGRV